MIKKEKLQKGKWYSGKGRNDNIALWTGKTFITFGQYYDDYRTKNEGLYEDGGCFIPLKLIKKEERKMRLGKVQVIFEYIVDLDNKDMVNHAKESIQEDIQSAEREGQVVHIINETMEECKFLEESDIPDFLHEDLIEEGENVEGEEEPCPDCNSMECYKQCKNKS